MPWMAFAKNQVPDLIYHMDSRDVRPNGDGHFWFQMVSESCLVSVG